MTGKPLLGELFEATGKGFYVIPNSAEFEAFEVRARQQLSHETLLSKALAQLPGGELDYLDDGTLSAAMRAKRLV